MAHKKGQGSTRNGRDSHSKRLGMKVGSGQLVTAGSILVRQRGTKWHPCKNVDQTTLFTLYQMELSLFVRQIKLISPLKLEYKPSFLLVGFDEFSLKAPFQFFL